MRAYFLWFVCGILICTQETFSQHLLPNYADDPSWVYIPSMSDEFNAVYNTTGGITLDPSKWRIDDPSNNRTGEGHACFSDINDTEHMSIMSEDGVTFLRMSATETSNTCKTTWDGEEELQQYTKGNLDGINGLQYGLYEVRFRIRSAIPIGYPFSPNSGLAANAWLFREAGWDNKWSEIDLAEIEASANLHTCNVIYDPHETSYYYGGGSFDNVHGVDGEFEHYGSEHWDENLGTYVPCNHWISWSHDNMRCGTNNTHGYSYCDAGEYPPFDFKLMDGWHTYSMRWDPDRISIFVDGVLINSTTLGCPGMEPLNWIIGIGVGTEGQFNTVPNENTIFPYNMDIDYIRTYQLQMDCGTVIDECTYDLNAADGLVKRSITIGDGSGCSNYVSEGSGVYLRATDFIHFDGKLNIPAGAIFTMETTDCY